MGYLPYQLVQDLFHQQYVSTFWVFLNLIFSGIRARLILGWHKWVTLHACLTICCLHTNGNSIRWHNDPTWIKESNSSRIRYIQQTTLGFSSVCSKPRVKNPKHLSRNCFGDSAMGQSKCALTARWKSQDEIVSWDLLGSWSGQRKK